MKWIAAFSQTGGEICSLVEKGYKPDLIVTNSYKNWDKRFSNLNVPVYCCNDKNMLWQTIKRLAPEFVTLHGYKQIIESEYCEDLTIINGHPGDVILYPELIGKDPQQKAIELGLRATGVVIHHTTAVVDSGTVLNYKTHHIEENTSVEQLIKELKELQLEMWVEVLEELL